MMNICMKSQQIHGPIRGKCQYMLDHDKGQTKHLSSMSCLWMRTRMSMDGLISICSLWGFQSYVYPTQFYTPSECDCDLLASDYESSSPLSRWLPGQGLGFFQQLDYCLRSRKTGSLWRLPTAYPPCTERPVSQFQMSKLIGILDSLFQTGV